MKLKLKEILVDAKKAVACATVGVSAAVAAGLIDGAVAAEISAVAGVLSTVLVYALKNVN